MTGDGPKVGNKIQHRHAQSPHRGVGHAHEVETPAHDQTQAQVDKRNGEKIIGNVLLNFVADFDRALLVVKRWRWTSFCRNKSRGQQQVEQHQRLADAHQKGAGPVKDGTAAAVFDLHRGRFFLFLFFFLLRRAQVVHRCRRLTEARDTGSFSEPVAATRPCVAALRSSTSTPGRPSWKKPIPTAATRRQHDRGGKGRNVAAGRPTDERFQGHSRHTSQEDRQDHGTGEVKKGHDAEHNQDGLHRCRFGRAAALDSTGSRFASGRLFSRGIKRAG